MGGLERPHEVLANLQRSLQLGGEQGRGCIGQHVGLLHSLLERGLHHPVDIVALPVAQPAELEHRGAVADLLHLRPAQVVPQLGMADQHDGELAAALRHEFGEALEGGQRLGVEVVSVVDEQRSMSI